MASKMAHKNFKSLREAVLNKAKEGMGEIVHDHIVEEMQRNIMRKVYSVYTPFDYERRYHNDGGLADPESIKGIAKDSGNGFQWRVRNESRASYMPSLYTTPLVVKGQDWAFNTGYGLIYDWKNTRPSAKYYLRGRDFITPTRKYVKFRSSYLTKQLENYMKR